MGAGDRAVDQERLGGAANAGAAHLGVDRDVNRHVEVGGPVDIDVADAFQVAEHRNTRIALDPGDQALAATRNDDVDGAAEPGEHQTHRIARAVGNELDGRGGKACGLDRGGHCAVNRGA